jgi:Ser/Thr protein kinase RdoA (MazF antagonist)
MGYDLDVAAVRLLAVHTNTLFRVDLIDGRKVGARVGELHANIRENIDIEVAWLAELASIALPSGCVGSWPVRT